MIRLIILIVAFVAVDAYFGLGIVQSLGEFILELIRGELL